MCLWRRLDPIWERAEIGVDAGFSRRRRQLRNHNPRLGQVAQELIDGQLEAESRLDSASGFKNGAR